MDRLHADESLRIGQELISNNGWFKLLMNGDGFLEIYRTQTHTRIWTSTGQARPGPYAIMQANGSFEARGMRGNPYWSTNTSGNPGASVVIQDDGNLVVVNGANQPLWTSGSNVDLNAPTIRYVGEGGFGYNETSEGWKQLCTAFPCFMALQWPGYATTIVEDTINGTPVVIQLWMGLCQKAVGLDFFPGGVGAEVGIYQRIPGKARPPVLPLPPSPMATQIGNALGSLADHELWWPFPELGATLEMNVINPVTGQRVFSAGPEKTYWLTKWMDENSYSQYRQQSATPPAYVDYILEYKVNGKLYPRWPLAAAVAPDSGSVAAVQGALLALG